MFPIRDTTPRRTFPIINFLIIGLNLLIFFLELTAPDFDQFIINYAFIPNQFNIFDLSTYFRIFSSMFMHGGFLHILSNLWFLHIFGDNVEDSLGHLTYLIFYLTTGMISVMAQYIFAPSSSIPLLGASGAISGVAGAYFVYYRDSSVKTLILTAVGFLRIVELPVWIFLGYWFVIQLVSGIGSLGILNQGGVAFFAHIGGFVFGFITSILLKKSAGERYPSL